MMEHRTIVEDALAIWNAGVDAVRADRVVSRRVDWDGRWLCVDDARYDLRGMDRLLVVGAGKATYGMLVGLIEALERSRAPTPSVSGWIQIPEGSLDGHRIDPVRWPIHVCEARPLGVNEPTPKVVAGSREMQRLVQQADAKTCVLVLLSGGGSALLCVPCDGVSLETKIAITRRLSATGATIQQLNEVRRCLSQVKGGGLASACHAASMITCILSDVLGDPLEFIASGPTVLEPPPDPERALAVLTTFCQGEFIEIERLLSARAVERRRTLQAQDVEPGCKVTYHILANNATAVDAAGTRAVELGYRYWMQSAREGDGLADAFGERFAKQLYDSHRTGLVDCLILGGEPTVILPDPKICGKGGRNQQVVLAAGLWLQQHADRNFEFALVSGGTDGEDGATDAAGAWIDRAWIERCATEGIDLKDALQRCDAYPLFQRTGNLLRTGPTHTNVCDLRVALRCSHLH